MIKVYSIPRWYFVLFVKLMICGGLAGSRGALEIDTSQDVPERDLTPLYFLTSSTSPIEIEDQERHDAQIQKEDSALVAPMNAEEIKAFLLDVRMIVRPQGIRTSHLENEIRTSLEQKYRVQNHGKSKKLLFPGYVTETIIGGNVT